MADLLPPEQRGKLHIHPRVVEKIAEAASLEVAGTARHEGSRLGFGSSLPSSDAELAGLRAIVDVDIAAAWGSPLSEVTQAVRNKVALRLSELAAVQVDRANVRVSQVVVETEKPRRVQ